MIARFILIALLVVAGAGHASITAAWNVPIEHFAPDFKGNERVRKLEKPPGESAFFHPGDELWDVSGVCPRPGLDDDPFVGSPPTVERQEWQGEWIVWNARSGMIVARSSRSNILDLQDRLGFESLPEVLRTKLDLVRGTAENQVSAALVTRSGMKATAESEQWRIEAEPVAAAGDSSGIIDERLKVAWTDGGARWEVVTSVTLPDRGRTRVAGHGTGENRWELFVTASREFFHGIPVAEARWQETPAGLELWPIPVGGDVGERGKLGNGLEVGVYSVPDDFLGRWDAEGKDGTPPRIEAPAVLAEWVHGPVVDLRSLLREKGFHLSEPGAFAGFDRLQGRVILVSTAKELELGEGLIEGRLGPCGAGPDLWFETDMQSGFSGLACRSGEKATISGKGEGKEFLFDLEPTVGANDMVIDVKYRFDILAGSGSRGRLDSFTTLHRGVPQVIASYKRSGREEHEISLVAKLNLPVAEAK